MQEPKGKPAATGLSTNAVTILGCIASGFAIAVGAFWLWAWAAGLAQQWGSTMITVKANMALAQFVGGLALLILQLRPHGKVVSAIQVLAGGLLLFIGGLTLCEHIFDRDLGIDQLLWSEPSGSVGVDSPNRMGVPGSLSVTLVGLGILFCRRSRLRSWHFGSFVCLIALVPAVGYLYQVGALYNRPHLTTIAWPSVLALMSLGLALVIADRHHGPVAVLTRGDAGSQMLRRMLPWVFGLPLFIGYARLVAERHGLYDTGTGTGLLVIVLIMMFSIILWRSALRLSKASVEKERVEAEIRSIALFPHENPGPVMRATTNGRLLYANPAAEQMMKHWRVDSGDRLPEFLCEAITQAQQATSAVQLEVTVQKRTLLFELTPFPQRNYVNLYGADITERRLAQLALQESRERFRLAKNAAGLGVFDYDLLSGRMVWDARMRELWGVDAAERPTLNTFTAGIHPDDLAQASSALARACDPAGNGSYVVEFRVTNGKDGVTRWVHALGQVSFAGGRATRLVGAMRDITQVKSFQSELERLVEERTSKLKDLVGELEHFSYSITHDMRAPLRAMRGFAEILLESDTDREQQRLFLTRIAGAAERMDALITDALNYSKAVRLELPLAPVDLGLLLRGMLDTYPNLQSSFADISLSPDLPHVLGNEAALTQCFSNLLGNAVKFVKPGKRPEVTVRAELKGEWTRIWVEDKGIGISETMLPRVFDMFSRESNHYEGTGIGLALVRKVVQRMGGRVGVESQEGKGSRFWVELRTEVGERSAPLRREATSLSHGAHP